VNEHQGKVVCLLLMNVNVFSVNGSVDVTGNVCGLLNARGKRTLMHRQCWHGSGHAPSVCDTSCWQLLGK